MNYPETLEYLYHKLPMFSRMGSAAFRKDLTNIRALCEQLGNPQDQLKMVHVGGTNGKGSVSHMTAAILQSAGYKTGLYTSPHLYDFRERIKVNGIMAEESFVVDFVQRIQPLIEAIEPSFFEITVAMAFDYFARQKVDVAVIEVGLGGRLDSTNIITPLLSVITNIGWDHMNMLGDTLEAIAGEKAGIIKPGVPVVIGERQPETADVFRKTAEGNGSLIYFAEDNYKTLHYNWKEDILVLGVMHIEQVYEEHYFLDLTGIYQARNIVTVLQAIDVLQTKGFFRIHTEQIKKGLYNSKKLTGLKGRWDVILKHPTVVLEVAHNKEGIQQMLSHLARIAYDRLRLVFGIVKDKDSHSILSLLPRNAVYYFTQATIPRALPGESLKEEAGKHGLHGNSYPDVNGALHKAQADSGPDDLIVVCGSIFLVAEVDKESIRQLT